MFLSGRGLSTLARCQPSFADAVASAGTGDDDGDDDMGKFELNFQIQGRLVA